MTADLLAYRPAPGLLQDRVILVTGAGADLGRAVALACAGLGAQVVLADRAEGALEGVYDEIEAGGGPRPALVPLDPLALGPPQAEQLAAHLEQAFGRLDGIFHAQCPLGVLSPIEQYDPQRWQQVVHANLHAPFLITRALLPLLRRAPDAAVLFLSDAVARRGRAYWGAYACAGHAREGLVQVLADEVETNTGIRVNSLDPGPLRGALRAQAYPGEDPGRWPPPQAVVPACLYLLGPDGKDLRGQALTVRPAGGESGDR